VRRPVPGRILALRRREFDAIFIALFGLTHLLLFFLVFFVLHQSPHADLPSYYVPEAHALLRGLTPYRDFPSSYAPWNSYLDALLLRIHDSPLSILVFQIACDILSVPFWIGFTRRFLPEDIVRKAAILYMIQPMVLWDVCIEGKNQACISLLLALALYLIARYDLASGVSYSLSLVLVKILPLIFLPALFLGARKRTLWLLGAVALPAVAYGAFLWHGIDVTAPIRIEQRLITGGDLPYLASLVFGRTISAGLSSAIFLLTVAATVLISNYAQIRTQLAAERLWKVLLAILAVLFTVLLFSRKSDPSYLGMCFFLICIFVAVHAEQTKNWTSSFYAALTLVVMLVTSLWFQLLPFYFKLHDMLWAGDKSAIAMFVSQSLLIFCYAWFLLAALHDLLSQRPNRFIKPA